MAVKRTEPKFIEEFRKAIKCSHGRSVITIGDGRQWRWKSAHNLEDLEDQLPMDAELALIIRRPYGGWFIITLVT